MRISLLILLTVLGYIAKSQTGKPASGIIFFDDFNDNQNKWTKIAKLFKEVMAGDDEFVNIMTEMTGDFNKVVIVSKYDSLIAYEQNFQKYMQGSDETKKMKEKMQGYHDMYLTGSRKIYQFS